VSRSVEEHLMQTPVVYACDHASTVGGNGLS
jgi:hypothetical protein